MVRATHGFARLVVALRFLILPVWILVALGALTLPGLGSGSPPALGGLLPDESDAIEAGERSVELFSVPLTSDTVVVQRDPGGLSARAQSRAVERAVRVTREQGGGGEISFALPVLNSLGVFPSSKERGTTAVTYLFFSPDTSLPDQVDLAHAYAGGASEPEDALVGVTGRRRPASASSRSSSRRSRSSRRARSR
jgi:putative drug exporter of the RND superfamily